MSYSCDSRIRPAGRGKKRPVVVVQADVYNARLRHVVVAEVTTNLADVGDPAYLLIEAATPDGQAAGLLQDSLVACVLLSSVAADRIDRVIGKLSDPLLVNLSACLKAALALP